MCELRCPDVKILIENDGRYTWQRH
jgi:hypothetical protein